MSTGATIMVIEDEIGTRITLCGILEDAGYRVIGLERGVEALEMIRGDTFDAVITDIRLPDVDGIEILELAKEINPDVAVIMMTGYASVETAVDAVNQGAYAYFVKPINPDEIKTTIANALKQQRLSIENKRLVESLQRSNKLLFEANEELRNEVTERKRAEDTLRESEERYRDLLENANDLIQSVTPDGRFLYVNKAWREMLGYSEEEVANLRLWDIIHPDSIPHCKEVFQKVISGETVNNIEAVFVAKDGKLVTVEGNANSRFKKGETVATRSIFRDITERKQVERELQDKNEQLDVQNEELQSQTEELMTQQQELIEKTEEVERATQAKSEFLANMSHELRTPLNVIIGFSELMMDAVPGEINKEQRQCLDDILSSGKNLLNLIDDVLDLSKVESGKIKLRLINFALNEVTEPLTRTMLPILTPREQSLDIEIEQGLPLIQADKDKLGQVLLNLVDNSSKFTPDGGKLKIEAVREGDWCRVSVIDNGIGIRKEDQGKIFEPFRQLDNPLTKEKTGTGLGLTLVKQIVGRYGGRIWLESEYGKGSLFTFTLPLATSDIHPEERNRQ